MPNPVDIVLHASGAETASASGSAVDLGATRSCVKLDLVVTTIAGTSPTLAVTIQTGPSLTGPWRPGGTLATVSAVGKSSKTLAGLDRYVRPDWSIGGTGGPSVTFSLDGQAHTLYASPADLSRTAINSAALVNIDAEVLADCCLRAATDAESALNSAYELPLSAWGEDIRGHCAARAAYYALCHRGFNPESAADQLLLLSGAHITTDGRRTAAQMFFDAVAAGKLKPVGVVDQTPDDFEGAGAVVSGTARDW